MKQQKQQKQKDDIGTTFTKWMVYRNGYDTGIIETDYEYARAHWKMRTRSSGARFTLVGVE